jgi:hypothetical protein
LVPVPEEGAGPSAGLSSVAERIDDDVVERARDRIAKLRSNVAMVRMRRKPARRDRRCPLAAVGVK